MYFLDVILTDPQRLSLTEAEVVFTEARIGSDSFHRHGIFIDEDSVSEAVRVLGVLHNPDGHSGHLTDPAIGSTYLDENGMECYLVPTYPRPTPENPVLLTNGIRSSGFNRFDSMSRYSETLLDTLTATYGEVGLEMIVKTLSTHTATFSNAAGLLHINIASIPEGMAYDSVRSDDGPRILMRVIGSTRDYFVIRNANGRYIAMFKGDTSGGMLWLLFDPLNCDQPTETIGYVMYSLARHLHPELGADEGIVAYRASSARRRYLDLARDRMRAELAALPANAIRAEELASEALVQYTAAARQRELARRRLTEEVDEASLLSQLTTQMEREFEAITASPDFTSVSFTDNELCVITRPLLLIHDGREYALGRYSFLINERNGRVDVQINGLDFLNNGSTCHPHVANATPCFGNQSENFAQLLAARQYGVLLPLIVMYLERGYQPTDSYRRVEDFQFTSRSLSEV